MAYWRCQTTFLFKCLCRTWCLVSLFHYSDWMTFSFRSSKAHPNESFVPVPEHVSFFFYLESSYRNDVTKSTLRDFVMLSTECCMWQIWFFSLPNAVYFLPIPLFERSEHVEHLVKCSRHRLWHLYPVSQLLVLLIVTSNAAIDLAYRWSQFETNIFDPWTADLLQPPKK